MSKTLRQNVSRKNTSRKNKNSKKNVKHYSRKNKKNNMRGGGREKLDERLLDRIRENDPTLITLDIYDNNIGNKEAIALVDALKVNKTLATLNMNNNNIGVEGAQALANALGKDGNTSLTILKMRSNSIGDAGAQALADALKVNTTLIQFSIVMNDVNNQKIMVDIKNLIDRNILRNKQIEKQKELFILGTLALGNKTSKLSNIGPSAMSLVSNMTARKFTAQNF